MSNNLQELYKLLGLHHVLELMIKYAIEFVPLTNKQGKSLEDIQKDLDKQEIKLNELWHKLVLDSEYYHQQWFFHYQTFIQSISLGTLPLLEKLDEEVKMNVEDKMFYSIIASNFVFHAQLKYLDEKIQLEQNNEENF